MDPFPQLICQKIINHTLTLYPVFPLKSRRDHSDCKMGFTPVIYGGMPSIRSFFLQGCNSVGMSGMTRGIIPNIQKNRGQGMAQLVLHTVTKNHQNTAIDNRI